MKREEEKGKRAYNLANCITGTLKKHGMKIRRQSAKSMAQSGVKADFQKQGLKYIYRSYIDPILFLYRSYIDPISIV